MEGNFALFCTYTLGFRNDFQNILLGIMVSADAGVQFLEQQPHFGWLAKNLSAQFSWNELSV